MMNTTPGFLLPRLCLLATLAVGALAAGRQGADGPGRATESTGSGPTWQRMTPANLDPPPVRIEPEVLDLGDLPPNTKVRTEFRLTNIGTDVLHITAAMSTCHCTVADLPERTIEPGKTISLPITFDSGPYISSQVRDVVIRFHGYARPAAGRVRADTNYGVRARLEFDPPEQRRTGSVTLESVDGEPFTVLSADREPPVFLDGFTPGRDEPRNRYTIQLDLNHYLPEHLPRWFLIELDRSDSPVVDLPIENLEWEPPRKLRPWGFREARMLMGVMPPMASRDVVVTIMNVQEGMLDLIDNVWVDPPIADAAILGMEQTPDGIKVRVRISPKDDARGLLAAELFFSGREHEESVILIGRIADSAGE